MAPTLTLPPTPLTLTHSLTHTLTLTPTPTLTLTLTLTLTSPLTHILRQHGSAGCDGDCMSLGRWVDGGVGEVGNWSAAVGVPDEPMLIDAGAYYASKDFWDGATGRRINWGW